MFIEIPNSDRGTMAPPKFIYLVRHGQSQANVNHDLLKTVPDWKVALTEQGRQQAADAGRFIRDDIIKEFPKGLYLPAMAAYCSPYKRTQETLHHISERVNDPRCNAPSKQYINGWSIKYDPRIREQDWGNYKDAEGAKKIEDERDKFGTFFYRIPDGESGADVYDRLSSFMDTLWRDFEKKEFPRVCMIVTHGLTMRLFVMRWLHMSVEEYECMQNPMNCEVWRISKVDGGKWHLDTQIRKKYTSPH